VFCFFGIRVAYFKRSLETSGLSLRRCRLKDLPRLQSLFTPTALFETTGMEAKPFGSVFTFWRWATTIFQVIYLIEAKEAEGQRAVGFTGLYNVEIGRSLWLSICLFRSSDRGHGYGKQAVELLLDYLEKEGLVQSIYVEVLRQNVPSQCFFDRLGFKVRRRYQDRFLLERHLYRFPFLRNNSSLRFIAPRTLPLTFIRPPLASLSFCLGSKSAMPFRIKSSGPGNTIFTP
jgi:RimJ/RimL family protein N-acetyltransferase